MVVLQYCRLSNSTSLSLHHKSYSTLFHLCIPLPSIYSTAQTIHVTLCALISAIQFLQRQKFSTSTVASMCFVRKCKQVALVMTLLQYNVYRFATGSIRKRHMHFYDICCKFTQYVIFKHTLYTFCIRTTVFCSIYISMDLYISDLQSV